MNVQGSSTHLRTWRWERQYASLAARETRIASECRMCSWGMVAEAIMTQVSARDRHMLFYGSRVAMSRTLTAYCAELRLNLASLSEAVLSPCPIFFRSRRWALWSIATRIQTHFRRAHVSHVVRTDRVSPALVVIFAPMQPERVPVI